jgi:MoaA/NifB/PqqE/SkfB family radical SAM enzyme
MIPLRNFKRFFNKALKQPAYASGVFFKRVKASFYHSFGKGSSSLPESVTLFLTHRCNLRCKMCGQWGEGGVTRSEESSSIQQELTGPQLRSLVDELAQFKPNITLFGGEPLLFPGCVDLIAYIKSKGMHCLMITNGSMLEPYAEGIVEAGLDELNLSLDGGEVIHDRIRGMQGLYAKIRSGIERLNYFKSVHGASRPLINLQCTITKYNYQFLEQLLDVAEQMKVNSLTFHNLIFISRDVLERQSAIDASLGCSSKNWEGFIFDPEVDPGILYGQMAAIQGQRYDFSVDFYPNFNLPELNRYYCEMSYQPKDSSCMSPWVAAYVFPDGELRPCLNSSYSFGNIAQKPLAVLWNCKKAVAYRSALMKQGIFPACVRCTELYRY